MITLDCPYIPDKGNLFEKREDCKCIDFEDQVLTAVIPEDSTSPPSSSTSISAETSPTDPELVTVTTARPCICNRMLRPVCGANRKTYPNPCLAGCEGVTIVKHCGCGAACDLLSDYDVIDDSSTTEAPSIAPPLTPDASLSPLLASEDGAKVIENKDENQDLDEEEMISTTKIPSIEDINELELDLVRQLEAFEEDTPEEMDENEAKNLSAEVNENEVDENHAEENEISAEVNEGIDEISSVDEKEVEDGSEDEGEIEDDRPKIFINENGDLGITTKGLLFYLINFFVN